MDQFKLHSTCNDKRLQDYGFRKQKNNYILAIPLYMYNAQPVIEARFLISLEDSYIHCDIIDTNSDTIYAAFYDNEYSNPEDNRVLKITKSNLNKNIQLMVNAKIILCKRKKNEKNSKI